MPAITQVNWPAISLRSHSHIWLGWQPSAPTLVAIDLSRRADPMPSQIAEIEGLLQPFFQNLNRRDRIGFECAQGAKSLLRSDLSDEGSRGEV